MTMLNTPDQIRAFQMCVQRAALDLEKRGMKHSGGALRPRLAASLGLRPRDSHDKFIAELTRRIDEAKAKMLVPGDA